ncbi:hypothetical protein GRJ2_001417200 [Grus japonensis]|uniref:Uncharacterized protein n=1 Tax=Grus japonensis TaxID=30415 RepID=A0ABC9WXJ1_GRUJA
MDPGTSGTDSSATVVIFKERGLLLGEPKLEGWGSACLQNLAIRSRQDPPQRLNPASPGPETRQKTVTFRGPGSGFLPATEEPGHALFPPASSLWWLGYFSHDSLRLDLAVPCLCQSNPNFLLQQ